MGVSDWDDGSLGSVAWRATCVVPNCDLPNQGAEKAPQTRRKAPDRMEPITHHSELSAVIDKDMNNLIVGPSRPRCPACPDAPSPASSRAV